MIAEESRRLPEAREGDLGLPARRRAIARIQGYLQKRGGEYAKCLDAILREEELDPDLQVELAWILFENDKGGSSTETIVQILGGADLRTLELWRYMELVMQVAQRGGDVGAAVEKYLEFPNVDFSLEFRRLSIGRDYGAMLLYGAMEEQAALRSLAKMIKCENGAARASAALALCLMGTEDSFRLLKSLDGVEELPEAIRDEVKWVRTRQEVRTKPAPSRSRESVLAMLRSTSREEGHLSHFVGNEEFISQALSVLTAADVELVWEARRNMAGAVHEAAIAGYLQLTDVLFGLINRFILYEEARR